MNKPEHNLHELDSSTEPAGAMPPAPSDDEEPLLYEEAPRLGWRDTLGVVVALIALAVIGVAGYIWLTPGMTFAKFLGQAESTAGMDGAKPGQAAGLPGQVEPRELTGAGDGAAPAAVDPAEATVAEANTAVPAADPLADLSRHTDTECPVCGMDGTRSLAHAVALWDDGTHTHHDCFDCLFTWGTEQGLTLARAKVLEHGATTQDDRWLDAANATYLYGTSRIEMSMPPYVAAFATRAGAEAALPELGGDLMDFAGLTTQWK